MVAGSLATTSTARQAELRGLRVAYVVSAALLVVLALATVASPFILPALRQEKAALSEAGKLQVLAKPDEWVLQYDLLNPSAAAGVYTFELTVPSGDAAVTSAPVVLHTTTVPVDAGRTYVFIYHVLPDRAPSGAVRFTVHRGDEGIPVEDVTLHLPPRRATS